MSDPVVVDVHVHVFEAAGDPLRDGYEIWEYGDREGVAFGHSAGTADDLHAALAAGVCTHCVVLGMFVPALEEGRAPHGSTLADRLRDYNEFILQTARDSPQLTPLIAADPTALGGRAGAAHLADAAERGARGVKVHPVAQEFLPDDPRMDPIYSLCEEHGLTVLSHSGSSRNAIKWADPFAFAPVMEEHPHLHLVLAHLGGASWHQVRDFAAAYPTVSFDLCEIIAWTDAPDAPTADELGRLIHDIGADRVLFGTDFPWYEVERTVDQLMQLPHLSDEERRGVLGENAVRRLGLTLDRSG